MPTVDFDLLFASDTEGLAEVGLSSNIAFGWVALDGDPSAGCVQFETLAENLSSEIEEALSSSTRTFEDMGVPTGKIIKNLQVLNWKHKRDPVTNGTLDYIKIWVCDSSGNPLHTNELINTDAPGANGSWITGDSGSVETVSDSPSNTATKFKFRFQTTTGPTAAVVRLKLDSIRFRITYDDPAAQGLYLPVDFDNQYFNAPQLISNNDLYLPVISDAEYFHAPGWINGNDITIPMPPDPDNEYFYAPTLVNGGSLKHRICPENNPAVWRAEIAIDDAIDGSSGGVMLKNGTWIALYTKSDGVVYLRKTTDPNNWALNATVSLGFSGKVRGLALSQTGVLCALVNNYVIISRDFGTTWELGAQNISGISSSSGKAYIVSSYYAFVIVYIESALVKTKVSKNHGVTFE